MFSSKKKLKKKTGDITKNIGDKAINLQGSWSKHVSRYLTRRSDRIVGIRRFTLGWLALAIGVSLATSVGAWGLYRKTYTKTATDGGTYIEGISGVINNLNPLFASGSVDSTASVLLFNGLLRYDTSGELENDLAKEWGVKKDNRTYDVVLKNDVTWHDGQPFTAQDVVFTIKTIQNPEARSTLYANWQGVDVKAIDKQTVRFELAAPTAPFPHSLTVPILPRHLLKDTPVTLLRTSAFNNAPVGTGPFVMKMLRPTNNGQNLEMVSNQRYFRPQPQVDRFTLAAYTEEEELVKALKNREITAAVDLDNIAVEGLSDDRKIRTENIPTRSGVFAFMKTTTAPLDDADVRRALVLAIDRTAVLDIFGARYQPLKTPLLPGQLGFNAKYSQATNKKQAGQILDRAGWKIKDGVRKKGKQTLDLQLVTADSNQYSSMASELQKQLEPLGVKLNVQLLGQEQLEQNALLAHSYDIFLYGVDIGADPDVYAYWHSSQAKAGGLNFSEWNSARADISLEVARTRLNPVLRTARYQTFLDEWKKSAPAIALYQPRINYSYNQNADGFKVFPVNNVAEHLTNVEEWTVNTRPVRMTP